jgi:hypothetical protein
VVAIAYNDADVNPGYIGAEEIAKYFLSSER